MDLSLRIQLFSTIIWTFLILLIILWNRSQIESLKAKQDFMSQNMAAEIKRFDEERRKWMNLKDRF